MDPQSLEKKERELLSRVRAMQQKKRTLPKLRNRIGIGFDLVTKMFAALLDVVGLILNILPIIGGFMASLVSIIGNIFFGFAYFIARVKPSMVKGGRRTLVVSILRFSFELVPFVNALPVFSAATWYINGVVRKEDREYNKGIRKALKDMEAEERMLRMEMERFYAEIQQYNQQQYNEHYEAADINQVYDEEEYDQQEDRPAA